MSRPSNYTEIETKLRRFEPFQGNTAKATMEKGLYRIYSRDKVICCIAVQDGKGTPYFFDERYSSREAKNIQDLILKIWGKK